MNLLKSLLNRPAQPEAAPQGQVPSDAARAIAEIIAESRRLRDRASAEERRAAGLQGEIERLEAERKHALADLRLSDAPQTDAGIVEQLATRLAVLRQELEDAAHVRAEAERRLDALSQQKRQARQQYQHSLGEFLAREYAALGTVYEQQALQLAETVFRVAAVIRMMHTYGAGNSNGFERRVYLPRIVPGDGRTHPAILDSTRNAELESGGARYHKEVMARLEAAGFSWNLKND